MKDKATFQNKVKVLNKLFDSGCDTEKKLQQGKKVLLVDADPQGDLTTCLGWQDTDSLGIALATKLTDVMNETMNDPMVGILHHDEGVDLIPANLELSASTLWIS